MVAEPTQDTYTDDLLSAALTTHPLPDANGYAPTDTAWAGVWDSALAAAQVWEEKAAAFAGDYDFSADGGSYQRSQVYAQMMATARSFRARACGRYGRRARGSGGPICRAPAWGCPR